MPEFYLMSKDGCILDFIAGAKLTAKRAADKMHIRRRLGEYVTQVVTPEQLKEYGRRQANA